MATVQEITIRKPFDAHLHLRRGSMLRAVTPYSAEKFWAAIIMPNTEPPIESQEHAMSYKNEILAALPPNSNFEPLMTYYLTRNLTPKEIERGSVDALGTKMYGVKYYPFGATTNSQWGYRDILEARDVLSTMEKVGMPLLLHGEMHLNEHDEEEDPYDAERNFIAEVLPRLLETYPRLKVSVEHLSSKEAVEFIEKNGKVDRLVATVTPHHLLYDRRHAFSGGYKSLLNFKPLVKKKVDRERLREMVAKDLPFIFAGTDSAPHLEFKKFSSSGAFGLFNAVAAIEIYTQIFDELNALDKLEKFLSINGPRFYGLEPSAETVKLVKKDWQVTESVVTDEGVNIWPICHVEHGLGNEIIRWKIKE